MSNRTSLISTTLDDGDPALYRESSDRDVTRQDFVCIGEAADRLPVPWLCCFRGQDLRPYRYRYDHATEGSDDDSMLNVLVPVTTLAQALENLEQSRPVFDALCHGDVALADEFWRHALRSIASAPMPFLTIELVEVIDSQESLDTLRRALSGGGALDEIKSCSGYLDGFRPYPLADLYLGGPMDHQARKDNTVALDSSIFHDGFKWTGPESAAQAPQIDAEANRPGRKGSPFLSSVARFFGRSR